MQPKPEDYEFDLDRALSAVVGIRTLVPGDAFTASTLGTQRAGSGVLIRAEGVVLTIGYLVTEAETVWITLGDGRVVSGHVLAFDQVTGFGLLQAFAPLQLPPLPLGDSGAARIGDRVVVAGAGGRHHAVAARIIAKQEFAGYWEYVLDEAIFTAPAHPNWGGAALIDRSGALLGIGSLLVQQARREGPNVDVNMVVPIDILKPILDDLLAHGRVRRPARPWLGLYATEVEGRIIIAAVADGGPAQRASLSTGDIVLGVAGQEVHNLAELFRGIWSLGEAGVEVPLKIYRDRRAFEVRVRSTDRQALLRTPTLH